MTLLDTSTPAPSVPAPRVKEETADPFSLLVGIIKANPNVSQVKHASMFNGYLPQDGYEEYQTKVNNDYVSLNHKKAFRAAFPLSADEIEELRKKRRAENEERERLIKEQEQLLRGTFTYLSWALPNGKKVGDCTGAELIEQGGRLAEVGRAIKPAELAKNALTEDRFRELYEKDREPPKPAPRPKRK
jgi:hypothetical protein